MKELINKILLFIPITLPNWLVEHLGIDKIVHGLITMYIVSIFNDFGVIAGLAAMVIMLAVGLWREKKSPVPDYSDVFIMFVCGFIEMVRYMIQAIIITEGFDYPLQFV